MQHAQFNFGTINVQPRDVSYRPWHGYLPRSSRRQVAPVRLDGSVIEFKARGVRLIAEAIAKMNWFGHAPTPLGAPKFWRAQSAF